MTSRFLKPKDVAEEFSLSEAQVYALIRSGDLPAVEFGGRGVWRIERLEECVERLYRETEQFVAEHPFSAPRDGAHRE